MDRLFHPAEVCQMKGRISWMRRGRAYATHATHASGLLALWDRCVVGSGGLSRDASNTQSGHMQGRQRTSSAAGSLDERCPRAESNCCESERRVLDLAGIRSPFAMTSSLDGRRASDASIVEMSDSGRSSVPCAYSSRLASDVLPSTSSWNGKTVQCPAVGRCVGVCSASVSLSSVQQRVGMTS